LRFVGCRRINQGEFNDESSAVVTVTTIFDPYSSAVESDVFIDERESQTNAGVVRTVSALAAA
jgi:hypothetical protein